MLLAFFNNAMHEKAVALVKKASKNCFTHVCLPVYLQMLACLMFSEMLCVYQVNLGVMMKNENIKEQLLVCLQQYHNLVGDVDGVMEHKLCIGKLCPLHFLNIDKDIALL